MPDAFSTGVLSGQEANKNNPFSLILGKFQESQARRYKEDSDRKKEEAALSKALQVLSYQKNYETELMKAKAEEERKTETMKQESEATNIQNLIKSFGMGGGGQGNNLPPGSTYSKGGFTIPLSPDTADKKFAIEQEEKIKQQEERSKFVKDSTIDTLKTIQEVEKGIKNFGVFGSIPSIPGTERKNWEVNVNKLLSGKIIDLMTTMKEASKTGATGFGQLSEKELKVLQEASTALKRGLAPKDAQKYLNDMKLKLQKIIGEGQTQGNDTEYQKYLKSIGQ